MTKVIKMSGCYFIVNRNKSNDNGLYVKIGMSSNIERRYKEICKNSRFGGNEDKLELFKVLGCKDIRKMERHLHMIFRAYNKVGEWFLLSESKIEEKLPLLNMADYN
jgi:hypothetical protein